MRIDLHPSQLEIFDNPARFKVVAAGRRFGKSHLACAELLIHALQETNTAGYDIHEMEVYYVAPTFEQGKRIMWPKLKKMGGMASEGGVIATTVENTATLTLINGRRISIRGADRPDTLRGVGISYAVMDEYAFMKSEVWSMIIRPALADVEGEALFIGTPAGKNHFYDLWTFGNVNHDKGWYSWQFESLKNPTINPDEIAAAITSSNMTVAGARQEYGASFNAGGGQFLKEESWKYCKEPDEGVYYVAVDLAGFSTAGQLNKGELKVRDEHAIAIVKAGEYGWWVKEIVSGRWDTRETALRILKTYSDLRPMKLGIEKGALRTALTPYLEDEQRRFNRYFPVWDLIPGNRSGAGKADRIRWGIEGRLEKGRIWLNEDEDVSSLWQRKLIEQATDFPSPLAHDDLLDALAYIDQLAVVSYGYDTGVEDTWFPLDEDVSGF